MTVIIMGSHQRGGRGGANSNQPPSSQPQWLDTFREDMVEDLKKALKDDIDESVKKALEPISKKTSGLETTSAKHDAHIELLRVGAVVIFSKLS